jgi:cytochrome c oxidase assembly factor CtaG
VRPAPTDWTFEPLFLALAAVAAVLYARAARREPVPRLRIALFALGLVLIAASLNSPLETLAAQYLLLMHLLQNVIVADWAPPLLVLGLTPAMRAAVAGRGGRALAWITQPKVALPVWLVGWYGIHAAPFYDLALRHQWLLNVEHALLIAIGLVFWWSVFSDSPHRLSDPLRLGYLFAGFMGSAFLGLALTFSPTSFYDFYAEAPRLWGLSLEQDQNYGGVLMTAEQTLVFLAAIGYFLSRLLDHDHEGDTPVHDEYVLDTPKVRDFVAHVRECIDRAHSAEEACAAVRPGFAELLADPDWLPEAYQRDAPESGMGGGIGQWLLFRAGDGSLTLFSLVVPSGAQTPIHDHLAFGMVGLYRGRQDEEIYAGTEGDFRLVERRALVEGDFYDLIPPHNDIHCVRTTSPETSVSIHLLTNDTGCVWRHTYDADTGHQHDFRSGYVNAPCEDETEPSAVR